MPTNHLPTPGQDSGNWGTMLNGFLTQSLDNNNGGGINKFDIFSQRPNNLTANDQGKTYLYTQTGNFHQWSGSDWRVLNESVINVKDYGAIGDGVVDDTAALQSCLDRAGSFKNYTPAHEGDYKLNLEVYIPTGIYKTTKPLVLPYGTKINGAGKTDSVIIKYGNTKSGLSSKKDLYGLDFVLDVDALIIIDQGPSNGAYAIPLLNGYNSIQNLNLTRANFDSSLFFYGVYACYVVDSVYKNIRISKSTIGFYVHFLQGSVLEEVFCSDGDTGMYIRNGTLSTISNCWCPSNSIAFDVTSTYSTMNSCGADGTKKIVYKLKGSITLNNCGFEQLFDKPTNDSTPSYAIWVHNQARTTQGTFASGDDMGLSGEHSSIVFDGFMNYFCSSVIDAFVRVDHGKVTYDNCRFDTLNSTTNVTTTSTTSKILDIRSSSAVVFNNTFFLGKNILKAFPSDESVVSSDSTVSIISKGIESFIEGAMHHRKFARTIVNMPPDTGSSRYYLWWFNDYESDTVGFYDRWKIQANIQYRGFDTTGAASPISGNFNVFLTKDAKIYEPNALDFVAYASNSKTEISIPVNYCVKFNVDVNIIPVSMDLGAFSTPGDLPDVCP